MDADPSLRITLVKDGRQRTFRIEQSTRFNSWAVIDSVHARVRIVDGETSALQVREEFDLAIRVLLENGWTPV